MDAVGLRELTERLETTKQDSEIEDLIEQAKMGTGELSSLNMHELAQFERCYEITR